MNDLINDKVLVEAMTWMRTPFHHKGCIKGVGVDCAHFVIGVFLNVGVGPDLKVEDYPPDWHMHNGGERFLDYVRQYCDQVEEPRPGDIAMFKFGRCAAHGSIVVEWPKVIHSFFRQGVVISSADGPELKGRLHSFWRAK
jgi:cell wall-associated NlpC family hydrolase